MAKVLLVDTNFSSKPIHSYLKRLGHEVLLCGGKPSDYLAKSTLGYVEVDYSNPQLLQSLCQEKHIDYVVPGCNDLSYLACAQVATQRTFTEIDDIQATHTLNNKALFRQFAHQQGLSVPRIFEQHTVPSVPVIVKPVDAFSGKGITILEQPNEPALQQALFTAKQISKSGHCIVEEYIEGQLYSHSAFITQQRVVQDFIVVEYGSANRFVVDTSHVVLDFPPTVLQRIRQEIEHIARSLRLKDGLIHTQFLLKDDAFYLVEITRRCPGDLYSQLIELSTGFPYAANYARAFLGHPLLNNTQAKEQHILRHTLTLPKANVLEYLHFETPLNIERWVPLATTGDAIAPSPASRIALLFARCQSQSELQHLASLARQRQLYNVNGEQELVS